MIRKNCLNNLYAYCTVASIVKTIWKHNGAESDSGIVALLLKQTLTVS